MKEIIKYIIVGIVILCLDGIWIASNFSMYSNAVKLVQKSAMINNYYAVLIAYILMIFTSIYIAIPFTKQYIEKNDGLLEKLYKSFLYGGAIGMAINGIYNFTSLAIYKDYQWSIAVYDTFWGITINTLAVFIYTLL